ncbi:modular serine protease-like isoform X2 [Acyrthosiphon pisum]|uniref:Peptidase S1 domain-containing protein n=1 Tax=Acyrthosiphon pisum TaxID=7029 RepID=A0A8R2NPP4_ACYPI|nr:modular serine protease-like isoform X2 [Acyrthosiphon pisum]
MSWINYCSKWAEFFFSPDMVTTKISVTYGKLKVAVGKYHYNFSKIDNEYTQILNVETIYIKESYNGKEGSYAEDIAVIVLENKVLITSDVSPVCIDWNGKYMVHNGDLGKIFIFGEVVNGIENSVLSERFLQLIDTRNCQKNVSTENKHLLTFDKFCTTYNSRKGADFADSGAGISFLHSNSYFLTGMLNMRIAYPNSAIAGFLDIRFYVQWIRGILNKHFTENSCVLPTVEGVIYSYEGSNEILSHGTLIKRHRTVIEKCEHGYHKAYPVGFRFCRGKGKWLSNTEKLCFKMCPSLISDSLDIKCSHNGKYANCSNLSIPDTIAKTSCKPFYTAPISQEDTPLELNCQANGMWNKQLYRCNPNCGRVYIINQVLIKNGKKALVGTAPWNVGIYQLNKKKTNYDLICGGSIIAPNLVISAAHCFWKKAMLSKKISITGGLYKVAVGKYDRNFTIIDNEFTQIINVETIHLKEVYYGANGFYAEDISIIVLQDRVSFSNGVSPVCIDWNGKYNVENGDKGKIVGWGRTEKEISSPILLEASLPYIDLSTCRNMYTNGFELFMTVDKFCAGSTLGQGVSKGDSGAGLCFLHSDSYYLTGVVSIKDPNTTNSIAVFTEVKYHIQWIRGLFNKHN